MANGFTDNTEGGINRSTEFYEKKNYMNKKVDILTVCFIEFTCTNFRIKTILFRIYLQKFVQIKKTARL